MQINKECEMIKKPLKMTQEEGVKHFNNKGLKMISAPDVYNVAKTNHKTLIRSLAKDFKDDYLVTSTQIKYNIKTLIAEITHDVKSVVVKPKKIKVKIPVLQGNFEQDSETEKYLQAQFDTKDSLNIILKNLKKFDKKRELRLWTPTQSERESRPIRSVGLYFDVLGRFGVDADWFDGNCGFSRGVIINSAKQSKKNKVKSK